MSLMASVITPPRPQREKWVAWPPERLPTKPNTFLATTSRKSGSIIAVGWDGSDYYAFDARCFHHGADLWTDDATRGGDIEDGALACPAHGRRIDCRTGAWLGDPCAGAARHRVYATRRRTAPGGAAIVEVRVDERDGAFDSDAYNTPGLCPSAVRARLARAAVTPDKAPERRPPPPADDADRSVRRRLAYESDDDDAMDEG